MQVVRCFFLVLALDVAASELYENGLYNLKTNNTDQHKNLTAEELIIWYQEICKKYPIVSIEDGLYENDWEGWQKLTKELGGKIKLVGDDLRVKKKEGIKIMPSQIKTKKH